MNARAIASPILAINFESNFNDLNFIKAINSIANPSKVTSVSGLLKSVFKFSPSVARKFDIKKYLLILRKRYLGHENIKFYGGFPTLELSRSG